MRAPAPRDLDGLEAAVDDARLLIHQGRPQQALRLLLRTRRALRTPDADPLLERILLLQAHAEFEISGDLTTSLELLTEAEALADARRDQGVAVRIHGQRGLLLMRAGDTGAALRALDRGVALLEYADPRDQTIILLNRSALHLEHGALGPAEEDAERCAEVALSSGDLERYWAARHNLGYLDFLAGRLPRAIARIEEALAPELGDPHPINLLDQARVLREAGLTGDADAILARAGGILRSSRLMQDLAETELARAECHLVDGDPARARAFAASALRRFQRRGNLRWQRNAEVLLLRCDRAAAESSLRSSTLRALAERAREVADHCRQEARPDLARAAELISAEAELRSGVTPSTPIPSARSSDPLHVRLAVHEVRGLRALQAGEVRRAAGAVRRGLAELGSHQNNFGSLDLRTASAVHGGRLAKLHLEVALASGRPVEVFASIEAARAVSTRLPSVRPPSDEETAALLAELRQVEEDARSLTGDAGATAEVARLRQRSHRLQRRIRSRAWELEGESGGGPEASARVAPVRAAADGAIVVSFARHRGRFLAVVVRARTCTLVDLAEVAAVDALVRRVRADLDAIALPQLPSAMADTVRRSILATLAHLDELLLRPLALDDRDLVVSVSGSLTVLPWGLLPSRLGHPTVVAPSATTWLRATGPRGPVRSVVAVAGPDLHGAAAEARRVASVWTTSEILIGAEASVEAVHQALRAADVVHVASHGTHRQDNPLFSSLRLANGQLFAYELDIDGRIAPFVALSACEAGLATVRPGDEGLGLTHVLLHLGSRSVLAGISRVRDSVAADVMARVHDGVAVGVPTATALASAQSSWLHEGVPAPFVSFGSSW